MNTACAGPKVLVLEDDPGIRRLERSALERAGYRAVLATSIAEARDCLRGSGISMLLLDYRIGAGESGLEFYRQLQAEGVDIPAILITGFGDEARIVEAMRAGVRDFIPKTPNFIELLPATIERVLEQVQQERRLQEAEASSRAKDDFLAALSHELRTPLTPVLALVSELQRDPRIPPDLLEDLATAQRNIELEARLIDDLLDVTRITRGKMELRLELADLRSLVEHAVKTCRNGNPAAEKLEWRVTLPDEAIPIRADPARMTQVLWNLIKNAVKFTPPKGLISVSASRGEISNEGECAVVKVSDSGAGIAEELMPRIFSAFEQGGRDVTRRYGGLGLGLAISKAIIEAHGGKIVAFSEGPGKGAEFTVRVPIAVAAISKCELRPTGAVQNSGEQESRPARLLLVEDHGGTAAIMERMLARNGFRVSTVATVSDAIRMTEEAFSNGGVDPVHLVISDLGLPDGSGLDIIHSLRAKYPVKGIALSGFGMEDDVRRSLEAGFDRHLTKPVDFNRLVSTIREVLSE